MTGPVTLKHSTQVGWQAGPAGPRVAAAALATARARSSLPSPRRRPARPVPRRRRPRRRPPSPSRSETIAVGMSVEGRPITAVRRGDPDGRRVLVIGVIHGDEQAGLQIVALLTQLPVPAGVDLYLVESMNPDGVAARHARQRQRRRPQPQLPVQLGTDRRARQLGVRRAGGGERAGDAGSRRPDHRAATRPRDLVPPGPLHDRSRAGPRRSDPGPLRRAHRTADGDVTGGTYTGVAAQWARDELAGNEPQPGVAFIVELGATLSAEEAGMHAEAVLTIAGENATADGPPRIASHPLLVGKHRRDDAHPTNHTSRSFSLSSPRRRRCIGLGAASAVSATTEPPTDTASMGTEAHRRAGFIAACRRWSAFCDAEVAFEAAVASEDPAAIGPAVEALAAAAPGGHRGRPSTMSSPTPRTPTARSSPRPTRR